MKSSLAQTTHSNSLRPRYEHRDAACRAPRAHHRSRRPVRHRPRHRQKRYLTLRACSLVSQRWRRIAQRALFAEAGLTTPRATQAFLATTAQYPHFANHVRLCKVYHFGKVTDATFRSFRSLREVYVGKGGKVDIAILAGLPQLEIFSVWLALVTCTGNPASTIFPALRILSSCFAEWDDMARQLFSPAHLPAIQGLALYHDDRAGGSEWGLERRPWTADFSAFPPSLRLVVSISTQYILDTRHEILHETDIGELYDALDAGIFVNGLRVADVQHLRIFEICYDMEGQEDGYEQLRHLVKQMPQLKSLFISNEEMPSTDASLRDFIKYVKQRGIRYVEMGHDDQHLEGSVIPPQWLEM
ncbi:RHTO0S12e03026g1_1 [Rhodotorula toruloides]|uniref:RHTO0S12e03026g1_1 n=1 Tax=Rhodotorula toruloides TaxID=5286 RepID=A0A061BAD9_RHOTO|nr:RHTO0S12e03026g1_1 [Rhodotorula toruloides]